MPPPAAAGRAAGSRRRCHLPQQQPRAQPGGHARQRPGVLDRDGSASDGVDAQPRRVRGEHLEVLLGGEALGLPGLGGEVERDAAQRRGGHQRRGEVGDQQVRQDAGEPGPGAEHHPVGLQHRLDGLRARRRLGRDEPDAGHLPRRGGHRDLAADGGDGVGVGRGRAR